MRERRRGRRKQEEEKEEEEEEEKNSTDPFLRNSFSRGKNATTSKSRENLKNLFAEQFRVPAISKIEKGHFSYIFELKLNKILDLKQNIIIMITLVSNLPTSIQPAHIYCIERAGSTTH